MCVLFTKSLCFLKDFTNFNRFWIQIGFMNSALQVLFNTQPLAQYFLKSMHLYELNTANKLGMKGQLAMRYAELLKEVWTASTRSVAPLKLRFCMTKHAPQFAGGGQHDSQVIKKEFLERRFR